MSTQVPAADRYVSKTDNAGPQIVNETEVANTLRVCQAEYNRAAADKREAAGVMRDEKRAFTKEHAAVAEEINAIMEAARERMKDKLRVKPAYSKAEADKSDAALRMRAVVKKLKDAGVDVAAFKQALKMGEMDRFEREEYFDNIDIYVKALRLWGGPDL